MKVGFRTISMLFGLLLCLGVVFYIDAYHGTSLLELQPLTLCVTGAFTTLFWGVGVWILGQRRSSQFYLGIGRQQDYLTNRTTLLRLGKFDFYLGENRGTLAYDIPLSLQRTLLFPILMTVSFAIVDSRSLVLFSNIPAQLTEADSSFCADEEEEVEEGIPPGCELVVRAYKLGYSKSLGNCESEATKKENEEICRKRQLDEPILHYTFRQIQDIWVSLANKAEEGSIADEVQKFDADSKNLDKLLKRQKHVMTASLHGTHHVFTNLKEPPRSLNQRFREVTESNYCLQKFSQLNHTIDHEIGGDPDITSKQLEYSYGHLLVNSQSQKAAGYCREFQIHWDMPETSCDDLVRQPKTFLEENGLYGSVQEVIDRYLSFAEEKNEDVGEAKNPLARAISFQCLNFSNANKQLSSKLFVVDGHELSSSNLTLVHETESQSSQIPTTVVKALAKVLVPHFNYSPYHSKQALSKVSEDELAADFAADNPLKFSQLEKLRKADIMLGHQWLHEHPDLLEVYPWHLHLYNFVESFRKEYRNSRGRL